MTKADRLQLRAAYIPKDYRLVPGPAGAAVYISDGTRQDRPVFYAMAFAGTAAKPAFHTVYRTATERDANVAQFYANVSASRERKAGRAAEKRAWTNPLKVGDILYTSWGYDQTNVEFYAVTKVSGRATWIREIAQDSESTGFMQEKVWPAMPIRIVGKEMRKLAQPAGSDGVYVKISESQHAYPEQGRAHYASSYA